MVLDSNSHSPKTRPATLPPPLNIDVSHNNAARARTVDNNAQPLSPKPILKSPTSPKGDGHAHPSLHFETPGGTSHEADADVEKRRSAFRQNSKKSSVRFSISDRSTPSSPAPKKPSLLSAVYNRFTLTEDDDDDDDDERDESDEVLPPPTPFLRQDSIIIKVKPGQLFSAFADLRVEHPSNCDPKLGTLGELRHVLRTGTGAKVKKFLRSNNWLANHRIRAELWKELCRDSEHQGRMTVYTEMVNKLRNKGLEFRPNILHGQGMVICDHQLKEHGRDALWRLLTVLENLRPDYTYIPIVYPLAATMLHYMDEPEAYSCIVHLLDRKGWFLLQTDIAISASRRTVLLLVKKYRNHVYSLIRKLLPSSNTDDVLIDVFTDWKAWVLRDLPFNHLVRVIDCFLFEGQKVLFRACLSLLHYWYRWHKSRPPRAPAGQWTMAMLTDEIQTFCKNIAVTPEKLMKNMFDIRNFKTAQISKCQEDSELSSRKHVDSSVARRTSAFNMAKISMSMQNHFVDCLLDNCAFIEATMALELSQWLPQRITLMMPQLLFNLKQQGTSFNRFWQLIDDAEPTIIIIKPTNNSNLIFGAYCSQTWCERLSKERQKSVYFGTGETFLFSTVGSDTNKPCKFAWVGHNNPSYVANPASEMYQAAGNDWLKIGGGGGDGLCMSGELVSGYSERCDTFNNQPLAGNKEFDIDELHVYGFTDREE